MDKRRTGTSLGALAASAALLLSGCGSGSTVVGSGGPTGGSSSPPPITADVRACAGVQAVIGHIATDSAYWSPTLKPFDPTISTRLARQARELADQGPRATTTSIRTAVTASADSFAGLAVAMKSKKRVRVTQAIGRTRVAYKALKKACTLADQ